MDKDYIQSYIDELQRNTRQNRTFQSDGINFVDSGSGTTYSTPADLYEPGFEQFTVNVNGNGSNWTLNIAKGRVLFRSNPYTTTTVAGCLKEYSLDALGVWPNGETYVGDYPSSPWIDKGGYTNIFKPGDDGGHAEYGVYIIANNNKAFGGTLSESTPYLAVMPVGGDAEIKTRPWVNEAGCDRQLLFNIIEQVNVAIEQPGPPPYYEPIMVSGYLPQSYYVQLQNYACQRVHVATVKWDTIGLVWNVTQHLVGPITIPYNVFNGGTYAFDPSLGSPPSWFTTPYYSDKQQDWEGTFVDCEKWGGSGANPTQEVEL